MRHIALLLGSSILVGTQLPLTARLFWLAKTPLLLGLVSVFLLSALFLVGWICFRRSANASTSVNSQTEGFFSILSQLQGARVLKTGFCRRRAVRIGVMVLVAVCGSAYGCGWIQNALSHRFPSDLDKLEVEMVATLERLEQRGSWQRLILKVNDVTAKALPEEQRHRVSLQRVQLNLYSNTAIRRLGSAPAQLAKHSGGSDPDVGSGQIPKPAMQNALSVGDTIKITAKLRAIRNFSNGLSFDYEAHQLRKGIDARGYIRSIEVLKTVRQSPGSLAALGRWAESSRLGWISQIKQKVDPSAWPWISGLVFGEQDAFTATQWRIAQSTGTLHLLVVSGLHLSAFAALGLLLVAAVKRIRVLTVLLGHGRKTGIRFRTVGLARPKVWLLLTWGLVSIFALFYVWLAGAGVALQRAWIMLFALLLVLVSARRLRPDSAICYAFAALLLINPLIYTGAGFWFSMAAVAVLISFLSGRRLKWSGALWLPQWVVFLGLLPVLLSWDQTVSLSHLMANTLAIPLMITLILPLTFGVLLLSLILPDGEIFQIAEAALIGLGHLWWQGLSETAQIAWPSFSGLPVTVLLAWVLMLACLYVGVRPVLASLGLLVTFVLLFSMPAKRPATLGLLDVGQGLSLVATENGRGLVYDTGPAYSTRFNAGSAILLPVLRKLGVQQIDALIVSHGDNDHAGGLGPLLVSSMPVRRLWLGQPIRVKHSDFARASSEWLKGNQALGDNCHRLMPSQTLRPVEWIDITEDLAYRFFPLRSLRSPVDNDTSCVVQIRWFGQRVLIPGDIGRRRELELVGRYGNRLKSDVLVVAHHGSRSSSSEAFLTTVDPQQAWISAGFNNRFGHPARQVTDRLNRLDIPWISTAERGAIWLDSQSRVRFQRNWPGPVWRQP
jgi:competence protein ComEC